MTNKKLLQSIESKFQPVFDSADYAQILLTHKDPFWEKIKRSPEAVSDYWSKLPKFLMAKCPICEAEIIDQLDLHSRIMFTSYIGSADYDWGYANSRVNRPCKHLLFTHPFLGLVDNPLDGDFQMEAEVPYISDVFLNNPEEVSFVTLNAFPICNMVESRFIPQQIFFLLVYFTDSRFEAGKRRRIQLGLEDATEWNGAPPSLYTPDEAWKYRENHVFDLHYWLKLGRLKWIDESSGKPELSSSVENFPYDGLEGIVDKIEFVDGKLIYRGRYEQPRRYPDFVSFDHVRFEREQGQKTRRATWKKTAGHLWSYFWLYFFLCGMAYFALSLLLGRQ